MFIDLGIFMMLAALMVPFISGYYAHSIGRSFWLWFAIGTFLPVISYFMLLFLPSKRNPVEKEIEQLRIKHRMLGTAPEIPISDPLRDRILATNMSHFALKAIEPAENASPEGQKRLQILIDGQDFLQIVSRLEKGLVRGQEIAGDYQHLPLTLALLPYKHLAGEPSLRYGWHGKCALLSGKDHRKPIAWAFLGSISFYRRVVVWHGFENSQKGDQWSYRPLTLLVFDRFQYEEALRNVGAAFGDAQ